MTVLAALAALLAVTLTHPQAAFEETEYAQGIQALEWHDGRLFAGYGDASRNTGPVSITPWSPDTGWLPTEFVFDTEAIYLWREIGDRLYAPALDPGGAVEYAVRIDGTWVPRNIPPGFAHVFDVVPFQNQICVVGSVGVNGSIWCGTDGGTNWREILNVPPPAGVSFTRLNFAFEHGGYLWTQADYAFDAPLLRWNGQLWKEFPPLAPYGLAYPAHDFAGHQLVLSWGNLETFTPQQCKNRQFRHCRPAQPYRVLLTEVAAYNVADGYVYAVKHSGDVVRSSDLASWETVANVPGALSVTADAGVAYVGLPNGEIQQLP